MSIITITVLFDADILLRKVIRPLEIPTIAVARFVVTPKCITVEAAEKLAVEAWRCDSLCFTERATLFHQSWAISGAQPLFVHKYCCSHLSAIIAEIPRELVSASSFGRRLCITVAVSQS